MSTASHPISEQGLRRLPAPILGKLRQLIGRIRRIALIKGIFAVAATALICLLSIMAIDAVVTIFSPILRWALTLSGLAITLAAAWWWILRPAMKPISLTSIAQAVEKRHPELQETISSSVELLSSDDPDELLGSRELIDEVVKAAVQDIETVSPRKEFDASPIRRYALAAFCFAGILTLLLVLWPKPASVLMVRAVAPFLEMGNAYADTMEVLPGDAVIAKGSDLEIALSIQHPKLERATVRRLDSGSSKEGVERMNLESTDENNLRTFVQTFPNVQEDLQYRVHAGNAVSRYFNVHVIDKPAIDQLTIRYDYPEYTNLPAREEISESGEIVALENTMVTVSAKMNRPMKSMVMTIGGEPQTPVNNLSESAEAGAEVSWRFYLKRDQESSWTIQLRDEHGFENEPPVYQLRATRDSAPTVSITAPATRELKLKPTEILPILYSAREDYGFSAVKLLVQVTGTEDTMTLPQPLPALTAPETWTGRAPLNLASLDLEKVREITVWVEVADSLPEQHFGPQKALSEAITIRLERGAKPLIEQVFEAQEREIRDQLNQAKRDLDRAKAESISARKRMENEPEITADTLEKLEEAREDLTNAETKIRELAEKMQNTIFADRAEEMKAVNAEDVRPARQLAEEIPLTDDQKARLKQAEASEEKIDEAKQNIDAILANLEESRDDVEKIAELTKLANEQQRLAMEATQEAQNERKAKAEMPQMSEGEQQQMERDQARKLAEWKGDQEDILKNLAELLKDDPEAAAKVLDQQGQNALKLADEAAELAKDQQSLKESTEKAQNPEEFAQLQQELMSQLERAQSQIAEDSQQLQSEFAKNHPEMDEAESALKDAAKEAQEAAKQLNRKDLAQAQERAAEAAKGFEDLAEQSAQKANENSAAEFTEQMAKGETPMAEASATGEMESKMDLPADANLANQLANLEKRQDAVAKTLDAVKKGQLEEAMAKMQEAISGNAQELEDKAKALEKASMLALEMEAKAQADAAEREFGQADQKSQQAAKALKQAQAQQDQAQAQAAQKEAEAKGMSPQEAQQQAMQQAQNGDTAPAQPTKSELSNLQNSQQLQQQSKDALEKAAQELAKAAQTLQDQSRELAPTQAAEGQKAMLDAEELAQSFEEVSQASQARNSAQAAEQASQAAQALQKMSSSVAEKMGAFDQSAFTDAELAQNGQASQQASKATDSEARTSTTIPAPVFGEGEGLPPEIEKLGISTSDWAKIQGALNSDITNQATSGAPQEYRGLVDQYFRMMAAEARKDQ